MQIVYSSNYNKTLKKLKKYNKEYDTLNKIIDLLLSVDNFNCVISDPLFKLYGFERMKYQFNDFYSFNLGRNGGTIRLLVKPSNSYLIVYLVHISYDHYNDFTIEKGDIDEK